MKIEYLKEVLNDVGTSLVKMVYFDRNHIVNTERDKPYPYVFWDMNSYKSTMNWRDVLMEKEDVQLTAYCIGYLDKNVLVAETAVKEQMYDTLREAFRSYLTVILANNFTDIINLHAMPNELFDFGLTIDAEIGVSFNVNFRLYCNEEAT